MCLSCGATAIDGARFCHRCGARVDGVLVEVGLPPGSRAHVEPQLSSKRSIQRLPLFLGAAALVTVVSAVLFTGDVSAPAPDSPQASDEREPDLAGTADESSAVDFSADEWPGLSTVGALDWGPGFELGEVWPLAFVEHDGAVLVFATGPPTPSGLASGGLEAWRSEDGEGWVPLGDVIAAPARIDAVVNGPDGLLAVGADADMESAVWSSPDGVVWNGERFPAAPARIEARRVRLLITATDDVVVVAETPDGDTGYDDLFGALAETVDVDLESYGFEWDGPPYTVYVTGPLGLRMVEVPAVELGFSDAEMVELQSGPEVPTSATVYSRSSQGGWQTVTLEEYRPHDLVALGDGSVLMAGRGPVPNSSVLRTTDGVEWVDVGDLGARSPVRWREGLIGQTANGAPNLRMSTTGTDWTTLPLAAALPDGRHRYLSRLAAGIDGVAAVVAELHRPDLPESSGNLVRDGFSLTRESSDGGWIVVSEGSAERLRLQPQKAGSESYRADLEEGAVTFLDPDNSEPMVTFTVDELRRLDPYNESWLSLPAAGSIIASSDTVVWSLNPVAELAEDPSFVAGLGIGQARVIAAVATPSSTESLSIRLFTARLAE